MSVHIAGERVGVFGFFGFSHRVPEVRGPAGKGIGEALGSISTGQLRQKSFGVAIAVGVRASAEQGQSIRRVPTQIPRAREPDSPQKQQGQQQALAHRGTACQGKAWQLWWSWRGRQRLLQLGE